MFGAKQREELVATQMEHDGQYVCECGAEYDDQDNLIEHGQFCDEFVSVVIDDGRPA